MAVRRRQHVDCDGTQWPYLSPAPAMGFQPVYGQDEIGIAPVQCRVTAKTFGKGAANVSCKNNTAQQRSVRIPRGYMFQPGSPDMQTLIAEKDLMLSVAPGQEASVEVDAFCGFSKNRVPRGEMSLSGLRAPSDVLTSQGAVWRWTRPYEAPPKPGTAKSSFGKPLVAAAMEQKILSKSYGIDGPGYKALQADLAKIDKDPKAHRTKPGDGALRKASTASRPTPPAGNAAKVATQPATPPANVLPSGAPHTQPAKIGAAELAKAAVHSATPSSSRKK